MSSPTDSCRLGQIVKRYDRYVYIRCLLLLAATTSILVGVNWVNLSVRALDRLVAAGQSPLIIVEYVALLFPLSTSNAIPLSFVIVVTYLFYRMRASGELIALKNAGVGPARIVQPFICVGLFGAVLSSLLVHVLIPLGELRTDELNTSTHNNIASRQIKQGLFHFPVAGMALFVADVADGGVLRNVFIHDARDPNRERTYFASEASLLRFNLDPVLELQSGQIEEWDKRRRELQTLSFDTLRFDLSNFISQRTALSGQMRNMSTGELLGRMSDAAVPEEADGHSYRFEIHDRIAKSLRSLIYPLIGVAALLLADAVGIRSRVTLIPAILVIVALHLLGDNLEESAMLGGLPIATLYVHHFLGLAIIIIILLWSCRARPGMAGRSGSPRPAT